MPRVPGYRRHKTGQAFCRIKGVNIYLGVHGSKESRQEYDRVIAAYLHNKASFVPRRHTQEMTVGHLLARYWTHAEKEFTKHGRPTGHAQRVKIAMGPVRRLHEALPLSRFGQPELKQVREEMVGQGWTRQYVNACVGCLKAMFKWGVGERLVEHSQWASLDALTGLAKGRTTAPERRKVRPVDDAQFTRTLAVLPRIPRAMALVQRLTGMRPVEVCLMRPCDIERSTVPWKYIPHEHKTEHKEIERVIPLGPQARQVLTPFLAVKKPEEYLFSPREATDEAYEARGLPPGPKTPVPPGERYTSHGYEQAVRRAAKRAGVPHWTPLQLRHTRATEIRADTDLDTVRATLGHASVSTSENYAELDWEKAAREAERSG